MRWQMYKCPTCGATKTINAHPSQSTREFEQDLPEEIFCGWRGCKDYAKPLEEKW